MKGHEFTWKHHEKKGCECSRMHWEVQHCCSWCIIMKTQGIIVKFEVNHRGIQIIKSWKTCGIWWWFLCIVTWWGREPCVYIYIYMFFFFWIIVLFPLCLRHMVGIKTLYVNCATGWKNPICSVCNGSGSWLCRCGEGNCEAEIPQGMSGLKSL
jgi:hypothetical protein